MDSNENKLEEKILLKNKKLHKSFIYKYYISSICELKMNHMIVVALNSNRIYLYDNSTFEEITSFYTHYDGIILCITESERGEIIVSNKDEDTLQFYKIDPAIRNNIKFEYYIKDNFINGLTEIKGKYLITRENMSLNLNLRILDSNVQKYSQKVNKSINHFHNIGLLTKISNELLMIAVAKEGLYFYKPENLEEEGYINIPNISNQALCTCVINDHILPVPTLAKDNKSVAEIKLIDYKLKHVINTISLNTDINNYGGSIFSILNGEYLLIYSIYNPELFDANNDKKKIKIVKNNLILQYKIEDSGKNLQYVSKLDNIYEKLITNIIVINNDINNNYVIITGGEDLSIKIWK